MAEKFDVTKHVLVPKHSKASKKEEAELAGKYNLSLRELPRILVSDPAVQHLDVKPGDVIKIVRPSATAGEVTIYRRVVGD